MSKVVNFVGMGHINIVVEDIDKGIEFYRKLFSAIPYQIFRDFSNVGFSKAAGFLEEPKKVKLHIAFLDIPDTGLTLELMQYVTPATVNRVVRNDVSDIAGVRHVALKVQDIESAFNHVSSVEGIKLINENITYKPYKIDDITRTDFIFFDEELETDVKAKDNVVAIISNKKYFYFIDKYGVQWEFEEGHTDVGNDK